METSPKNGITRIVEVFGQVKDPRIDRKKEYPLGEIILLTICGVISNCDSWDDIADFGNSKLYWLRKYLPYENGIPSHDIINRTMSLIDARSFESCFLEWSTMDITLKSGTVVNLDGKRLRGSASKLEQQTAHCNGGKSARHIVHAWCNDMKLCIGQYQVADKSNEIVAVPELLDLLSVEGCILTIDAMGCQKNIVSKIRSKQADYIIGVKENQPTLLSEIEGCFQRLTPAECSSIDYGASKGHGRSEVRICTVMPSLHLPEGIRKEWDGLSQVVRVESLRRTDAGNKLESEKRYYITSLNDGAETVNNHIRGHWSIENNLHWVLDVGFKEDSSKKRRYNSPENFSVVLKICMNLLGKTTGEPKMSMGRKRKKCALSDEFREKCLQF